MTRANPARDEDREAAQRDREWWSRHDDQVDELEPEGVQLTIEDAR